MPYIIAVLALIVVGVGFTLYQSSELTVTESDDTAIILAGETTLITELPPEMVVADTKMADVENEDEYEDSEEENEDEEIIVKAPPVIAPKPPTITETPAPAVTPNIPTSDYVNGTYTAQTTYRIPDRDLYTMDVSITVSNDKITATTITFDSRALRDSYVKRFNTAYQSYVVGKDLGTINLSRVAGASLTTDAFNNALADIKIDAKA